MAKGKTTKKGGPRGVALVDAVIERVRAKKGRIQIAQPRPMAPALLGGLREPSRLGRRRGEAGARRRCRPRGLVLWIDVGDSPCLGKSAGKPRTARWSVMA
jgi:hypothetical protein